MKAYLLAQWQEAFILKCKRLMLFFPFSEKEQQEAIEHIDEVQNEIDR